MAIVAGVSFLVAGVAAAARVEKSPDGTEWATLTDDYDQAVVFSGLGIALLAAGGAALAGGLFWVYALPRGYVETDVVAGFELGAGGSW